MFITQQQMETTIINIQNVYNKKLVNSETFIKTKFSDVAALVSDGAIKKVAIVTGYVQGMNVDSIFQLFFNAAQVNENIKNGGNIFYINGWVFDKVTYGATSPAANGGVFDVTILWFQ